jgi:Zinc knuckle
MRASLGVVRKNYGCYSRYDPRCFECRKVGHYKRECPALWPVPSWTGTRVFGVEAASGDFTRRLVATDSVDSESEMDSIVTQSKGSFVNSNKGKEVDTGVVNRAATRQSANHFGIGRQPTVYTNPTERIQKGWRMEEDVREKIDGYLSKEKISKF